MFLEERYGLTPLFYKAKSPSNCTLKLLKCHYDENFACPFFFQILKIDVLNGYHANFYLKIPTESMSIVT